MSNVKLAVGRISKKDPIVRQPVGLKQSTWDMLAKYSEFYEQAYNEPVEARVLLEHVLLAFFEQDKAFKKYTKEQSQKSKATTDTPASAQSLDSIDLDKV